MSTLDQVIQTVSDTLNLSLSSINENSSADNIDVWDSLAQVNLMIALEQTFDIELEVEDFMELVSVRTITDFVEKNA